MNRLNPEWFQDLKVNEDGDSIPPRDGMQMEYVPETREYYNGYNIISSGGKYNVTDVFGRIIATGIDSIEAAKTFIDDRSRQNTRRRQNGMNNGMTR
ncbi:MAG: hypothetical protein IKP28_01345 [Clostridia bacterium]|nr:hypothetical protein [Clostridia bacterium]